MLIVLILSVIFCSVLILFTFLFGKNFYKGLKANRLMYTTIWVVFLTLIITYFTTYLFSEFNLVKHVGSVDAWIGFAGSAMGGVITMLALYFTLKQNTKVNQNSRILDLKPYVACRIINIDTDGTKLLIKNCVDNYGYIECKMRNVSNNIANGIRIVDEYSSFELKDGLYRECNDLSEEYGISVFSISLNDGAFLAPQEEYKWKINFGVALTETGDYKWGDTDVEFRHTVIFEFTDIANLETYWHKFEFEININVDLNDKLHFFLWNVSNSIDIADEKAR